MPGSNSRRGFGNIARIVTESVAGFTVTSDISSVPNDFLATNRPYAIVNCTGEPAGQFQQRSATARGGFVLDPDLGELDELVRAAGGAPDPTAVARKEARDYLLGPRTADPAARFRAELERICRA